MWNPPVKVEVRSSALGRGVFAAAPVAGGETVLELPFVFADRPGQHTIQVDARRHQAYTGDPDDFLNHSCAPSCRVDVVGLRVVALAPLAPGDELTFDYRTTEWDLVEPFVCCCDGRPRWIRGFRHLSGREQAAVAPAAAPWMRRRLGDEPGS